MFVCLSRAAYTFHNYSFDSDKTHVRKTKKKNIVHVSKSTLVNKENTKFFSYNCMKKKFYFCSLASDK